MYVRVQKVRQGGRLYEYVHIVEGYRDQEGKVRHRVVANLGRRDRLKDSGALDNLAAAFTRLDPAPGRYLVGALPLAVPVLQRLDIEGIVDRACPMRGRARLTHGEVIAALVANRLTAPRPLYDVAGWAHTYAVNEWLGTPAGLLNDDRLGRALDALAGCIDEVASAVALAAISVFGADAARLHWDFTSVAFSGAYADQDPDGPRISFGHSSDRRAHQRQLKVAHATTAAGIPLFGRVVDGARHEGTETGELLERLRALAQPRRLLLVADSALVTKANLAAADAAGIRFVSRLPRRFGYEPDALALPVSQWRTFSYCSERSRGLPPSKRPSFTGAEASLRVVGPDKTARRFRVLYVYGSEEAEAARKSRAKLLARAEEALERIAHALVTKPRQDPEPVERRLAKAVSKGHVGNWLHTEISTDPDGNLRLHWWRDTAAIADTERRDGLYALVTNMSPRQCTADRLLTLYKDQHHSERAHRFLKGPLNVRPVFLKSNRRAAALVAVCSIALLVYGLIEAEVRRAITPARTITGLLPEGRAARPTAENIFKAFNGLGYQRARTTNGLQEITDPLTPAQQAILDALNISSILPSQLDPALTRRSLTIEQCGMWD
ncbi:MAG: IS1634 family transposase [Acidimicrobiia bacterium]